MPSGRLSGRACAEAERSERCRSPRSGPSRSAAADGKAARANRDFAAPSVRHRGRKPATCSRHCGASACRRHPSAAEQLRPALGGRQQPGQHFHGGGLAAAVGAEEAEDLAAPDAETDMIHGDEIAETPRQPLRLDGRRLVAAASRGRTITSWCWARLCRRQQGDEGGLGASPCSPGFPEFLWARRWR